MKKLKLIFIFLLFVITVQNACAQYEKKLSEYSIVQHFINRMVTTYNFNESYLVKLFDQTALSQEVINKIENPYEKEPWFIYKKNFLTEERITYGVKYWKKHQNMLQYVSTAYGIPPEIIVAVVGIESFYGKTEFKYPVINSLATLSFAYPKRSTFFSDELEQYLLLARELDINPKSIKGSYAGAIGLPQFMPSSYRSFGISSQAGKKTDLIHDTDDVILSVANFLHYYGWQKNKPIAIPAKIKGNRYEKILSTTLKTKPKLTIAQIKKYHVSPIKKVPGFYKGALLEFEDANDYYEYWLAFNNFYVLSRYNGSSEYVLAVINLAYIIKQRVK